MQKRTLFIALFVVLLTSCQKEPDWDEFDNEYLVYTQHDDSVNMSGFNSYFISDKILVIGDTKEKVYMDQEKADVLIAEYVSLMNGRGYRQVSDKNNADLGIQVSYISSTYYFAEYTNPYWWWGYPGYWDPYYWGYWGSWGYGFPIVFSYSENSLLTEMVNLTSEKGTDKALPVVWNSYINGDVSGYTQYDADRLLRGIDQSFGQSPYISTKK